MAVKAIALPMREAQDYWKAKVPMPSREFYDLAEAARANAFSVSGVSSMDMFLDIHRSLAKVLDEGLSFNSWKAEIADVIKAKGWTGESAWRVDNIFRTNIQTAYNVGRWSQMQRVKSLRPYWQYDAINDGRTRPTHRALDGMVFEADAPFWDTFYPPNGFRCRCGVNTLSARQVEARGLKVEKENPYGKLIEPRLPDGTKLPAVLLMPDRGFEANAAKEHYKPDLSLYPANYKQAFLDKLLERSCPDDWADFAQSPCWMRLKKHLGQDSLEELEALVWAKKEGGIEGYKDWAESVLRSRQERGELYPVGNLPPRVLAKLEKQPRLSLVTIDDRAILHMSAEAKRIRGTALSAEEIASIPEKFGEGAWYLDKEDPAILMTWVRLEEEHWCKVVIRLDRTVGKGVANRIVTTGVVQAKNILKDSRYVKL